MTKVCLCSNSKHPSPSTALLQGIASIPKQSRGKRLRELRLSNVDMSLVAPHSLMNLSSSLSSLILNSCGLQGKLPSSMRKFKHLQYLNLGDNSFSGPIPYDFEQLTELVSLVLSGNENGYLSLEPTSFDKLVQNLTQLNKLHLSFVDMSLVVPNFLMNLSSSLSSLKLYSCGLQGKFPSLMTKFKHLQYLDLRYNNLTGSIPYEFGQLSELVSIDLCYNDYLSVEPNSFDKIVQNLTKLRGLRLGYVNMDLVTPNSLANLSSSLSALALWGCGLQGKFPDNIFLLPNLQEFDLTYNDRLTGSFPSTNVSNDLQLLGLSRTRVSVDLGNDFFTNLKLLGVLVLRDSNVLRSNLTLIGHLTQLTRLDLVGQIPDFLSTLTQLENLGLSGNHLLGTIPSQISTLSLKLNNLSGPLPTEYLYSLEALMASDKKSAYMMARNYSDYAYSIRVTWKGFEIDFERIQSALGILDFSNNNFTGEIPNLIGKLNGLRQLNLSHNSLRGQIPLSLGMLFNLESLDLSSNLLTGRIPQQLASITFLAVLNLSHNQLEGAIPRGKQFQTFSASSFEGNLGLCGFPMPKDCSSSEAPALQPSNFDDGDDSTFFGDGFGWKAVAIGYGCGVVFGVTVGYVVFRARKPAWFLRLVEDKWNLKARRTKKNARRNGVRRN
ncbi:hypothetical protein DKX38_018162 [Salix brachista]|uniref:Leucine-rich repeat-containing N-terminal plant-type domain-containing protein n=1 Tax=Salix brachista TaxID=2182728 RepID=A0A5N5KMB7_9ROSI|nr:hypothetical protein DKX38_018162 [Salix brachista]